MLEYSSDDGRVSVVTSINMRDEVDISQEHSGRVLSNGIKICVNSNNARFIQFATRLTPDTYTLLETNGKVEQWYTELSEYEGTYHYMKDGYNPRWKVDVTTDSNSCFYDEKGAHIRNETQSIMYDEPGGLFEPIEERSIFCTFVVINNQVTHKIRWSKQNDVNEQSFYSVDIANCDRLPSWAIASILRDYNKINNRIFELPNELAAQEESLQLTVDELNALAREDFLPPPKEWITRHQFPSLFPASDIAQQPTLSLSPI